MIMGKRYEKCRTCKHFRQHYIKRNSTFWDINCGHCVNDELNGANVRNKYVLHANCEFWELEEDKKVERHEHIKEVLQNIEKHLNEIAIILKNDGNSAADD